MIVSPGSIQTLTESVFWPQFWRVIAGYSQLFFLLLFVGLWSWAGALRTRKSLRLSLTITGGLLPGVLVNELLKLIFARPRPFAAGDFAPLVDHAPDFALPSNHAMATAVFTYAFCRLTNRYLGGAIACLTLLVGFSRVATGLHYPVDILAGWLVGALLGVFGEFLTKYLEKFTFKITQF